ncbi:2-phosphosulfolactate phosphatase [Ekhidna lutea]|uniref:Probable 2-phosphosulfolactate phosphatase n=1 Tax=Ekhidna lutea TaxID=447679 RepID=A0A239IPV3_EKHLU|nr:2-phosphosulfolactate phosphatase [Ekhidna lutea]SNS95806.1 2-phosphosulfolactate phosphatase [Ekhidna lutea]
MNTIEVCLTPELIHQHALKGKLVVVVDIFRATSCIVTGLANDVEAIKPVAEVDECKALGTKGYIMAGERDGIMIEGFDIGNSPFDYQSESVKGKKVAISTTNGSKAILLSEEADEIIIGSFLNLDAVAQYILQKKKDVVIHCAGWKGTPNLEDTLFAGALIDECAEEMKPDRDSALVAHQLFIASHENMLGLALQSSHAERLKGFGIEEDLEFCMEENKYPVVPKLVNGELVS